MATETKMKVQFFFCSTEEKFKKITKKTPGALYFVLDSKKLYLDTPESTPKRIKMCEANVSGDFATAEQLASISNELSQIKLSVSSVFSFKGIVSKYSDLKGKTKNIGDIYYCEEDKSEYVYIKYNDYYSDWEKLGPIIDLTNFYTKEEIDEKFDGFEGGAAAGTVEELTKKIENLSKEVQDIKNSTPSTDSELENKYNALNTKTSELETAINELKETVTSFDYSTLSSDVSKLSTDTTSNTTAINNLTERISTLESKEDINLSSISDEKINNLFTELNM